MIKDESLAKLRASIDGEVKIKVPLAIYTSFKIGGPAKYFYIAKSSAALVKAVAAARDLGLPFFILGGGSNVLIADRGFEGLVVKAENREVEFLDDGAVKAGAGMNLAALAALSAQRGLGGLEFGVGIPGSLGGAVRGNAGCFSREIKEVVSRVTAIDQQGEIVELTNDNCQFAYRDSVFKQRPLIILEVYLLLTPNQADQKLIEEYRGRKDATQDFKNASAGCVFKNPAPDIYAGKLIDDLGLKGKQIGGAKISAKHGNFILNTGQATAEDVIMLISLIKEKVRSHYGIQLKEEVQYVGF